MSWEGPDKYRDEDYDDPTRFAYSYPGAKPEVGSEAWVRAEVAAGRSGEEHDRSGGDTRNPRAGQVRVPPASVS